MKSVIKKSLQSMLLVPVIALGVSAVVPALQPTEVFAQVSGGVGGGANAAQGEGQPTDIFGTDSVFQTIVNVLLFIIGAVAVIMLVYGGFRYVTSAGDSSAVTSAKNTILYAVIGIIVAILAYAVVNFVITNVPSS